MKFKMKRKRKLFAAQEKGQKLDGQESQRRWKTIEDGKEEKTKAMLFGKERKLDRLTDEN